VITLPDQSRAKLSALQADRMAAEDAFRGALGRLNGLPSDADPLFRERLEAERVKQTFRHQQLSRLLSAVQQFLSELPPDVVLEEAPSQHVELGPHDTLTSALVAVRGEISTLRAKLQAVKSAPLPVADQKELAAEFVVRLAQTARPSVNVVGDQLRVGFRGDMAAAEDVFSLLCWAMPAVVCEALEREIDAQPVRPDAMPQSERVKLVTEMEAALDRLERREAALIETAAQAGLDVLPRADMSPCAYLNCVIIKAPQAAAA
jgi:hypothetical protein